MEKQSYLTIEELLQKPPIKRNIDVRYIPIAKKRENCLTHITGITFVPKNPQIDGFISFTDTLKGIFVNASKKEVFVIFYDEQRKTKTVSFPMNDFEYQVSRREISPSRLDNLINW